MNSRYNLILGYLKSKGIENMSKSEKRNLFNHFKDDDDIRFIKREIDLLLALNRSLVSTYGKLSINNMLEIYRSIDDDLLGNLFLIYDEIKDHSKNEVDLYRNFSKVVGKIMATNENVNEEIANGAEESYRRSLKIKDSLYLVMCDKEKADSIFDNCINRSKLFIKQCEINNLEEIIHLLKTQYTLTNDELVRISTRCASFFSASSVSKIDNLYKQIEDFKKYIKEQEVAVNVGLEISRLLNKEFKDVLFEASSVATFNQESINKTLKFLMGSKLGSLTNCSKRAFSIKGNFTPYQLAKIYNESISSLSVSVEKIADVCDSLFVAFKKKYGTELDLSKFINGLNFRSISQLRKEDYLDSEKLDEVFELLSMFVSKDDMENLLRNNLTFLTVPVDVMKKSLQSAVLTSQNKDELRYNVLQKIRNHFDMYHGQFKDVERKEAVSLESHNKVKIKDIDEEEIKDVLTKLDTSKNDIDLWKKKWNDEEREYRDLQTQIELEDIKRELAAIEDLLHFEFIDIHNFLEDMNVVKNMVSDSENKYNSVLEIRKINKNLQGLSIECKNKIESLYSFIDNRIENIVEMYKENLEDLTRELSLCNDKIKAQEKNIAKRDSLVKVINEHNLSQERLDSMEQKISEICDFLYSIEPIAKSIKKKEMQGSKLACDFFEFLKKQNIEQILASDNIFKNPGLLSTAELYREKFTQFIYCLQFEGLIENAMLITGIAYNGKVIKYEDYRRNLSIDECQYTDKIYKLYKENMDDKEKIRATAKEFLVKYDIEDDENYTSSQRLDALHNFVNFLQESYKKEFAIIKEREKLDSNIDDSLALLKVEEEKLSSLIKEYLNNIELLIISKIKR